VHVPLPGGAGHFCFRGLYDGVTLKIEKLRHFRAFADLNSEQLKLLGSASEQLDCEPGTPVLALGSDDPYSYFLLSGRVEMTAADGQRVEVSADSERARNPLADLRPRKYAVKAVGPARLLKIESGLLRALASDDLPSDSVLVQALDQPTELRPAVGYLWDRIRSELDQDRLPLPTLPEVATRIGQILHQTSADAKQVANVVALDPAMAAKITRAANSPVYSGLSPVASLTDAIMRLGFRMSHNLVISYALRDLYKARSGLVREQMQKLWRHSVRVASFAYVLAGITRRFDPDRAMLAGLLHDIGLVPVYSYLDEAMELVDEDLDFSELADRLRAPVGARILRQWSMDDELVQACREAELWERDLGEAADLADLVVLAQLHLFMGTRQMQDKPAMEKVPAFRRVFGAGMTPEKTLAVLARARQRIEAVEQMLRSP
jgi:HD-like signal output (HDOD) protein